MPRFATLLHFIFECLGVPNQYQSHAVDISLRLDAAPDQETQEQVDQLMAAIRRAEKPGHLLQAEADQILPAGWTETVAIALHRGLVAVLRSGVVMVGALKEAWARAVEAFDWVAQELAKIGKVAWEFTKEHPLWTAVIAFGILVVLFPWAIEALGFAELGPVEGRIHLQSIQAPHVNAANLVINRKLCRVVAVDLRRLCASGVIVFLLSATRHGLGSMDSDGGRRHWSCGTGQDGQAVMHRWEDSKW